ncbi:hypothetical protein F4778DRAFT_366558 [Xylariomycetidae sp. FL2044]|nr:hypothetical protein F4778DRAFT_366558 [Xylariomycetidae sp. FL2044]
MSLPENLNTPSIASVSSFLQSIFPARNGDAPFHYHTPRTTRFNPHMIAATHIVLSITPTPGFYTALRASPSTSPIAFLHRPWTLDRRQMPRHGTVLTCHKGFDEVLTTGNNAALAVRLGMDLERSTVIRGYKGDLERTIGIVGPIPPTPKQALLEMVTAEFQCFEGSFGFDTENSDDPVAADTCHSINALAIMNAFHPEEVDRVSMCAIELGISSSHEHCDGLLYLTGAVRQQGLQAAMQKRMKVICVGHRTCEEWGIRYLAEILQRRWPSLRVDAILEDEVTGGSEQAKVSATRNVLDIVVDGAA